MKILDVQKKNINKILSIDPASHSLAFAVLTPKKLVAKGKVMFPKGADMHTRQKIIAASIPKLLRKHKPDYLLVEESIYLQNPTTSRTLAYIVGGIWCQGAAENVSTGHVGPLKWKPGVGYRNVSKKEKDEMLPVLGTKGAVDKWAANERKERVRTIVLDRIPGLEETDTDITDAIAIGLWGLENL